jgi:DNA-binding NtrC family response regulator
MRKANIRVLAATNRDIEARVSEGAFREDLLHRLNVVRIHLPPLRDRRDDVAELFSSFVLKFRGSAGRGPLTLAPTLLERLATHTWPGNVREVVNVARYVAGLALGPEADISDLPPSFGGASIATRPSASAMRTDLPYVEAKRLWIESFDERYFERLLDAHGGNISAAARAAEIDRKTIQRFLKRAGDE